MQNAIFVQLFFGFPSGIISLLLSALGIWKKWPIALILAGIWAIPATYYLSAAFGFPLYLISLLQLGGAYALYKGKPRIAWYLLIPLLLFTLFMTYLTSFSLFAPTRP
jgi:hypothetical protein